MARTKTLEWAGVRVEAGPDAIFHLSQNGSGSKVSLVIVGRGFYAFPETTIERLVERYREEHARDPECVLVTGTGIYVVTAMVSPDLS